MLPSQDAVRGRAERPVTYSDVAPIFGLYCNSCHGPEEDDEWWIFGSRKNVNTRSYSTLLGDTDVGRVVIPGEPGKSRLLSVLSEPEESDRMPLFGKPLSPSDKNLLRRWIAAGALHGEEPTPTTLKVTLQHQLSGPPVIQSTLEELRQGCLETPGGRERFLLPPRADFDPESIGPMSAKCQEYSESIERNADWERANAVEVSCRVDSEAYVELTLEGPGGALKRHVATFKAKKDYGDAAEPGEWFTWRQETSDPAWPAGTVQLDIKYSKPLSSAVFLVSVGSLPEDARKMQFNPNPIRGTDKGRLELWLPQRSDVQVAVSKSFSPQPPLKKTYQDLAKGRNDIDIVGLGAGHDDAKGLYTVLVDVKPRMKTRGDGEYWGALAVWLD